MGAFVWEAHPPDAGGIPTRSYRHEENDDNVWQAPPEELEVDSAVEVNSEYHRLGQLIGVDILADLVYDSRRILSAPDPLVGISQSHECYLIGRQG
jgi:hypothetical protein